jgi:broad specificity phosphatase PhoE
LRGLVPTIRGGRGSVKARLVADDCEVPAGSKKVHLIRHGEGVHNVAQREWRSRPEYDGRSEPYTVDNDPSGKYTDALLTPAGEAQARALQPRTQQLSPQLLIVSPLRRATQTVCHPALEPRTSRTQSAERRPQTALVLTLSSRALDRGCWLSRRTWRREG